MKWKTLRFFHTLLVVGMLVACSVSDEPASPPVSTAVPGTPISSPLPTETVITIVNTPAAPETQSPVLQVPTATFDPPPALAESGQIWISPADDMALVFIPAGHFWRGSRDDYGFADPDERPQRKLIMAAFWMDQFEVSNAQYAMCVDAGACTPPLASGSATHNEYFNDPHYDSYPVINVNWYQAETYCEWVGRRLPTEAEWEKAARGKDARRYPWEWVSSIQDSLGRTRLNFCDKNCPLPQQNVSYDDGFADTAPTGSFPAGNSPYDVFDMAGNVWEWTADWYASKYYQDAPEQNPPGPDSGSMRVIHGGSWMESAFNGSLHIFRAANRSWQDPAAAAHNLGFRCSYTP